PIKPIKINVELLKDYVLRDQIPIINEDLRNVEIFSDRTVLVSIDHNNLKKYTDSNDLLVIYCENSFSPVINTLFNYCGVKKDNENNKYITGLLLNNSTVNIKDNKGFTNFPYTGVFGMNNSNISAYKALFSENGIFSDKHGAGVRVS